MSGECECAERLTAVEEQLRQLLADGAERMLQIANDDPSSPLDSGDTAWVLTATTLVLFMTIPGQAIFYAGMVRTENVLATAMEVFSIACLMTVLWHMVGYSIAFGPADADVHSSGIFGGLDRLFLYGMGMDTIHQSATTIPEPLFCAYQLTFAVATPTLMCGSFAERMRYFPCLIFMGLWLLLVYCPVAHAIWHPDGFLNQMGIMDFAGGLVVHLNAGIASLMCVVVIGSRKNIDNNFKARYEPHNILFTIIGCCMMWVAWYGFNAGGAYKANGHAGNIILVTQIGASVAAFSWMFVEWAHRGSPSVLGMVNGGVCGLVCITPACGFVDPGSAFFIGLIGGAACLYGTSIKHYVGFDDAIDAFGVNTTGGIVGTLLTGIFATKTSGPEDGLIAAALSGNFVEGMVRMKVQMYGIIFVLLWSGLISLALLISIDNLIGLRVTADEERLGLDEALHSETLTSDSRRKSIAEILNYEAMYGSLHDTTIHGASTHYSPYDNISHHGTYTSTSIHGLQPIKEEGVPSRLPFWQGGGMDLSRHRTYSSMKSTEFPSRSKHSSLASSRATSRTSSANSILRRVDSGEELRPGEVRYTMDASAHNMPMIYSDDEED